MRIIGYLDSSPGQKITVFRNENKLILKFEEGLYELSYKFRINAALEGLEDLKLFADEGFRKQVQETFAQMREQVANTTLRYLDAKGLRSPLSQDEEEII